MNIDERIEALTQSVRLLSQMHQDNEKHHREYFRILSESLKTLTRLADGPKNRISKSEGPDAA